MSSYSSKRDSLDAIARLVRKGGYEFPSVSTGQAPQVMIGSKSYYVSGIFYDPDSSRLSFRVVDSEGRIPSDIESVRSAETLSPEETRTLQSRVESEYNDVRLRRANFETITKVLNANNGVIEFADDAPEIFVNTPGQDPLSAYERARLVRIDSFNGSPLPASGRLLPELVTVKIRNYGGRRYTFPFVYLSDGDLTKIASSKLVSNLAAKLDNPGLDAVRTFRKDAGLKI